MKKIITIIIILLCAVVAAEAARKTVLEPSFAWRLVPPLGLREPASIDTLPDNYARRSVPSEVTDAWATTGNLGGAGLDMIWDSRPVVSDFFFRDAFSHWLPTYDKMRFYNTRIPMTLLSYNTGGGRDNAQDRLQGTFSGNINRQAQVGAMLDYLYSKGSYANQAAKNLSWGLSGSYLGDRYEMQAFFYHYNLVSKENGGITDPLYITDPALIQGGVTSVNTKTIPTRLSNAHTRVSGQQAYLNQRYKIGYWHEEYEGDSVVSRTYIPVTSVIWTFNYTSSKHNFHDDASGEIKNYFENTYYDSKATADRSGYWSVSNTVGLSLLEGFHRYAKFGLAGFLSYDVNHYNQPVYDDNESSGLTPLPDGFIPVPTGHSEHNLSVGGQLTKQHGSILTYSATARFGIAGRAAGDLDLQGQLATRFPLLGDTASIAACGSFTNTATPYFLQQYKSNHFVWHNDFGKERRVKVGGSIDLRRTDTHVEAGISNVQNHLYFNEAFLPAQHGGNVQIFSASLHQGLHVGILHWDNAVTFQTTTDDAVIPLPRVAVYSNMYLKFRIATLYVQLGVDCDYYTRYFAPKYQPATASFAVQRDQKIGNYPFMNAYANFKLSKVRFYVMMSNVNQGWFSSDYFSMPYYPLNPRRFQLGLTVDFAN